MRSRHLLACFCGALASGGALLFACNSSNDALPPIYTHIGGGDGGAEDAAPPNDSGSVVTLADGEVVEACVETSGASPDGGITIGPTALAFDPCGNGSPDALYWDATNSVLYIGDDQNAAIWTWSDAKGFQKLASVPVDDGGSTVLGGIAGYGNLIVVSRNGGGASGALFQYDITTTTGIATTIGGAVDPTRHRTGVAYDSTGARFFSAAWGGEAGAGPSGTLDLIGVLTTTPYVTGLDQPHGVLVSGTQFIVGDNGKGAVIAFPVAAEDILDAGAAAAADDAGDAGDAAAAALYTTLATIEGVDQLSAGPGGSILAGQHLPDGGAPQLQQISADGGVVAVQASATFTKLGGIAYDTTYNRVFVADSNGGSVRTIKIYPLAQ
jgi:hypothetical protein